MTEISNIYKKLQTVRRELCESEIKKTGENKFLKFKYFELGDFLPTLNKLMDRHLITSCFSLNSELASLTVINSENPNEEIVFTCPAAEAKMDKAQSVQNLGATITYLRRYLTMIAFEIAENDVVDATAGAGGGNTKSSPNKPAYSPQKQSNKTMATPSQVARIKQLLEHLDSDGKSALEYYKVDSWNQLTVSQAASCISSLIKKMGEGGESTDPNFADSIGYKALSAKEVEEVLAGDAIITPAGDVAK